MHRSKGFSLAEMMVVVGIIAMLAAIIVPTLGSATAQARCMLCLNNLHRINQAAHTWSSQTHSWDQHALADGGWTALVEKVCDGPEVLRCPEGGPLAEGEPIESMFVIRTSPSSSVGIPLVELLGGGGFKILKLSGSQRSRLGESQRITPEPYKADSNPNVYYWCYDDGAIGVGDYDFQDLVVRVTKKGSGTASMFAIAETGGHPEVWSPDFKTRYAQDVDINKNHYQNAKGVEWTLSTGGVTNYGMNLAKLDMRMPNKIQAMDYLNATAASTDNWDYKEWDQDKDGKPDFIRHNGRLNAVMLNGAARSYRRWQIDPQDIEVARKLWQK